MSEIPTYLEETLPRASQLVALLQSHRKPRSRTGLLLLGDATLGQEQELAARLSVQPLNYVDRLLKELPTDTQFVAIDADTEKERLARIANERGNFKCVLIYNFDLILAKLDSTERTRLWDALREHFPYHNRPLLFAIPARADRLRPDQENFALWQTEGRLAAEP